jgi:hypothetical protein
LANEIIYSDFRTDFAPHPITGDIALVVNEDSVIQEIKSVVLTAQNERWNQSFGGNQAAYLFELPTRITEEGLKNDLLLTLKNNVQRAEIQEVRVTFRPDLNAYAATIIFSVLNTQGRLSLDVLLKRVR